jgi:hypothetical protein
MLVAGLPLLIGSLFARKATTDAGSRLGDGAKSKGTEYITLGK